MELTSLPGGFFGSPGVSVDFLPRNFRVFRVTPNRLKTDLIAEHAEERRTAAEDGPNPSAYQIAGSSAPMIRTVCAAARTL